MKRYVALALAVVLAGAAAAPAAAQRGARPAAGGGGARPSGGAPAAPVFRAPAPPAPVRPPSTGGFDFHNDITVRPAAPPRPAPAPQPQRPLTAQRPAPAQRQAPLNTTASGGPYSGRFHGPPVANPHHWTGPWTWNHGIAWQPVVSYWGGGFWGPFALGSLVGTLLFGSIDDLQTEVVYPSYEVEPDSPGAELLQNYGLQQTPCGPPNLVVIWGPDNSVICAFPNDAVGPGNYELDPSTLTLISEQ